MSSFWDKIASLYDAAQLFNRSVNKRAAAEVESEIKPGMTVLDCAAGTGMLSLAAAKNAKHVVCTDCSKPMLIRAMKKARQERVHNISFARRDICNLKDPDSKYDAVIAGNVLHLLDDPEKAVSELIRVTKKGGKIILPTFLTGEAAFFKVFIRIYSLFGFDAKTNFTTDSYLDFIAGTAENNGCKEYSTRLIFGALPAGFAVITK